MSTRGIYGFRKNKTDKLTYNHSDSYPSCLGETMLEFCKATSFDELNDIYERITLVDEETTPTAEQIEACRGFADTSVSTGRIDDWYCLLREMQGEPSKWKEISGTIYMIDNHEFIKDSLFCEYGYIINLDTNKLEFWVGFQKRPSARNRYGNEPDEGGYYPCRMVASYPLDSIDVCSACEDMEKKSA